MDQQTHLMELTRLVNADHVFIHHGLECFKTLLTKSPATDKRPALEHLQQVLGEKVFEYFALEEERIFPELDKAAATPEVTHLITELVTKHQALRKMLAPLGKMLPGADGELAANQGLTRALVSFFIQFREHAVREDQLLVKVHHPIRPAGVSKSSYSGRFR